MKSERTKSATERQQHILASLESRGVVSIEDLVAQLGVSAMTVHRDLDKLAAAGQVRKSRGEVLLPEGEPVHSSGGSCALCHAPLSAHGMVLISRASGERRNACCTHCGLLLLLRSSTDVTALVVDFINHHMVDAGQAVYVVESSITLCCSPAILSFSNSDDAERFCTGFGGMVIDYQQALAYTRGARF